jgi:hypothetical protein
MVEGAHLVPRSNALIQKWKESGDVAVGIMLQVSDEEARTSPCWCAEASGRARVKTKNCAQVSTSPRHSRQNDWTGQGSQLVDCRTKFASRSIRNCGEQIVWSGEAMEEIFRSVKQQLTSRSLLWEAEGRTPNAAREAKLVPVDRKECETREPNGCYPKAGQEANQGRACATRNAFAILQVNE